MSDSSRSRPTCGKVLYGDQARHLGVMLYRSTPPDRWRCAFGQLEAMADDYLAGAVGIRSASAIVVALSTGTPFRDAKKLIILSNGRLHCRRCAKELWASGTEGMWMAFLRGGRFPSRENGVLRTGGCSARALLIEEAAKKNGVVDVSPFANQAGYGLSAQPQSLFCASLAACAQDDYE